MRLALICLFCPFLCIQVSLGAAPVTVPFWSTNGQVNALTVAANVLYVGGAFSTLTSPDGLSTISRSNLAAIDLSSNTALAWAPNPDGAVYSFLASGSDIYVGGEFQHLAGQPRGRGARFDQATLTLQSWNPASNNRINAMVSYGGLIYASGFFTTIGGQSRFCLAQLDPLSALAGAWNPNPNGSPAALAAAPGGLYVGGAFTTLSGQPRAYLGQVDYSGAATAFNPSPDHWVESLLLYGGYLYVGGVFSNIGGVAHNSLAIYNEPAQTLVSGTPDFYTADQVFALTPFGTEVRAGGFLTQFNGAACNNVASFAGGSGTPDNFHPNADNELRALASAGFVTYLGGFFGQVDGASHPNLAAVYDGPTFTPTITSSVTDSPTVSPTQTPTFSVSPSFTVSPSFSASPTMSETPTVSPTFSLSPTFSASPTVTLTLTSQPTPAMGAVRPGRVFSYPNPFKLGGGRTCKIRFAPDADVKIEIYDIAGRKVAQLLDSQVDAAAGLATWDGRLYNAAAAAPGLYLLQLHGQAGSLSTKFTVIR
jgi:hypothetical protein